MQAPEIFSTGIARTREVRGTALLEILGVLCALTIVLAVLVPAVLRAIDAAMLASTVQSVDHLQKVVESYYQKYGKIAGVGGSALSGWVNNAIENWDRKVLLAEGFIETPLRTRLATNVFVRVARVTTTSSNTAILSYGNLGSLGGFNGNNGLYNFTQEYAAVDSSDDFLPRVARGSWVPAFAGAVLVSRAPGQWLVGSRVAREVAQGAPLGISLFSPGKHLGDLLRGFPGEVGPGWIFEPRPEFAGFEVCYPLPSGTPLPAGDIGYNVTVPNPMFPNPDAKTQIVAPSSTVPAYVVELILKGVSVENAYRLSRAIDGVRQSNWAYFDSLGRVKYDMYDAHGGTRTGVVFVYLAHK